MADVKFKMTVEDLVIQPIGVELSSFTFGSASASASYSGLPPSPSISQNFTIQKASDQWSVQLHQASQTGKKMQIAITSSEQLTSDSVRRVTFAFTNVLITSIQTSGNGATGILETIQLEAEGIDLDHSSTPGGGASYKGSHKGRTK